MTQSFKIDDVPDLTGKVAIVTGGTSGIGRETAYLLARRNCTVHIAARNQYKAHKVISALQKRLFPATHGVGEILFHPLDLLDLKATHASAQQFLADNDRLDIIVANAGLAYQPADELSVDGYDLTFHTNHLGHFAFVTALMPLLERTAKSNGGDARVVVTTSTAYQYAGNDGIDFETLTERREGDGKSICDMMAAGKRYGRSKMANILFMQELDKRLRDGGVEGVRVNACHPGMVGDTGLGGTNGFGIPHCIGVFVHKVLGFASFTPQEGAMTQTYLATHKIVKEDDIHGKCYAPVMSWFMRYLYSTEWDASKKLKAGDAKELWEWSERAVQKALREGLAGQNEGEGEGGMGRIRSAPE